MAVRFDKVSDETQPTLERILSEKARLEAAGVVPAQPGSGLAVRRQSSVLAPLESSGRVSEPASSAPTARVDVGTANATGAAASTATTAPAATKTAFLGTRTAPAGAPGAPGPFTRARQTSTRPVPVPSALFEPPTAADIDKALSVLEEAPGPAPMPQMPSVPRFVPETEDISNDPTRVADAATAAAVAEAAAGGSLPSLADPGVEGEPAAANLAASTASTGVSSVEKAAVAAPAGPDVSRRFRAASRAYPTLNRRRGTGVVVALIVIVGAAGVIWKLRPGSSVPPHPVTTSATTIAPPTAPEPAPTPPPAPAAEATPPPAPAAVAPPPVEKPAEKPAAEKPAAEERSSSRRSSRHRSREEAVTARAAATEAADKTAEAKPAEAKAPEKAPEEKPGADKPAAPEASAPAAEAKPAGAVLKITSSPAGADVSIDGSPVGMTPFTSRDIDPGAPHAITLKKDGFETNERMVGASDWSRPHGSTPPSLKVNVKLRRTAPPPGADAPKETGAPAEDTGGPYIKEVNPSNP